MKISIKNTLLFFTFFILSCSSNMLQAQNIIGKWIVNDVTITVGRTLSEAEKEQIDFLRKDFLEENKGKTIVEYKKDSTLIMSSTDTSYTVTYKWWIKDGKLHTSNPADDKRYIITYTVVNGVLYISKLETAHGVTIKTAYIKKQ
jgi:hypothetical protein